MLISLKLHVNIESMVEEQVYFLITIFLNPLDQKILVAPLLQMLTLLGFKDDFFADFALGGVAEAGDRMSTSFWTGDQFLAIGALDIIFEILILRGLVVFKSASSRSSTIELLLSAEELCTAFSIDVQDLHAVDIHGLLSNTPAWLLFLAFLY